MTIQDYIDAIEDQNMQRLSWALHHKIVELVPQIEATIKFKTPFYVYYRWLCYFTTYKNYIELSFVYGYLLSNEQGILTASPANGKGKELSQIRKVIIADKTIIESEAMIEIIAEATLINEEAAKNKVKNYARARYEAKKMKK